MKKTLRILSLLIMVIGALLLVERPAYAYADPGTGLLAIQAAGSALVAVGWYLRRKIYSFMRRGASPNQETPAYPSDEEPKDDKGSAQP